MRHLKLLTLLLLAFCSCRQNNHKKNIEDAAKTIQNVFDISNDTIIACKYGKGLILSNDGGKSWTELETNLLFDEVTLTDNGYLVGLDSWRGIHEPDYSRLYLSKDFGKTWKTFNLDTKTFFPLNIVSNPKEKLLVQTVDNKIYQLNGLNLTNDWTLVKNGTEQKNQYKEIELPYKIDDSNDHNIKLLLEKNKQVDTLAKLATCRQVNNVASFTDFVYISGAGYEKSFEETYAYFASYSKETGLKEYKIPGHFAYLKKTQHNNIYIMNDEGLFITNKDTLQRLY
ncbi:MAG: hypothetical protein JWQ96_2060 [Segetibacter sp.]|nr:hypothetical protein [Segetibacter sp.]